MYIGAASSGGAVTRKQRIAISGTHAPAYTTLLSSFFSQRIQIFLEGQRRGARQSSPGLHRTSHQLVQTNMQ